MTESRYLGVDGCKAGWFFVSIGPGDEAEFGVFENINQLFHAYSDSKWILIDIPIGLPSKENPRRNCDIEARKLLGPKKASTVFPPPCREATKASNYTEANQTNRAVLAKGMSQQTFHICKKIKETDEFLLRHKKSKKIVRESHPEICFWALSGQRRLEHNKKTPKGLEERLEILIRHFPRSSLIYKAALDRYLRKEVSRDDILDAMALAISATNLSTRGVSLPEKSEKDSSGFTMEIVYALPEIPQSAKNKIFHQDNKMQAVNMAIVNKLEQIDLDRDTKHTNVNCTYSIIESDGAKFLQIDTYGSATRKIPGKKNQSIRFDHEAIKQLKKILRSNF